MSLVLFRPVSVFCKAVRSVAVATVFAAPIPCFAQDEPIAEARPVPSQKPVDEAKPKALRPLTVATELIGNTKITGTLVDATALSMRTNFGEAQLPLSEIAGIRFASGDSNSTTVVMLNGDSITGVTDIKFMTIETEWGTAKINGQSLLSMLFVPGLQWESSNGLSGKRWTLTEMAAKPNPSNTLNNGRAPTPGTASGANPNSAFSNNAPIIIQNGTSNAPVSGSTSPGAIPRPGSNPFPANSVQPSIIVSPPSPQP